MAEAQGTVESYTVAADIHHGDWLFGLGVTVSQGEGEYEDVTLESDLTTAHPYAAWTRKGWLAWATLGRGAGTLDMYDAEHDTHYRGIDITHTMVGGGVDREHSATEHVQTNLGVKGFWSVTKLKDSLVESGHVLGARAPNLSLESYVDWTFNPDGAVQPTLGMALTYDRDDYETNTHLRPSVGVNVEYGALRGHLEVVLVEGQWDTSGNVMFQPKRGLYAGLTRSARELNPLTNAQTQPQMQLETGWKRNGLSPYMALGADSWRIGQKLRTASHEFDVYLRNERDEAEVRVGWRLSW